jgi:hypothetical protein
MNRRECIRALLSGATGLIMSPAMLEASKVDEPSTAISPPRLYASSTHYMYMFRYYLRSNLPICRVLDVPRPFLACNIAWVAAQSAFIEVRDGTGLLASATLPPGAHRWRIDPPVVFEQGTLLALCCANLPENAGPNEIGVSISGNVW